MSVYRTIGPLVGYFYDNNETVRVACVSVVLTINLPTTIYCAQTDINVELAL